MSASRFRPRPGYDRVTAYRSDPLDVDIDLRDNTNQWGVAPSALEALRTFAPRDASEYPPVESVRLAEAIASYVGADASNVVSGCGSDDILDAAMRALAQPGETIVHPVPTFAMIPILARTNGLTPVGVPVLASGDPDADAMLAAGAQITYLCTPNNPTGTAHARATVERVIANARGAVIVDEAYAEYADNVFTADAPRHSHVLCTRTLSKSFGLAGLRIGFGIGAAAVVDEVAKARGPYKVNSFAERAAHAALTHDREWMADIARQVRELRPRFAAELRAIGLEPLTSEANFLCVPVRDARAIAAKLLAQRIAIRPLVGVPGLGDALRIGLAPWPVLERVVRALRTAVA
jgi:histidinol-phosphate aminotransferase